MTKPTKQIKNMVMDVPISYYEHYTNTHALTQIELYCQTICKNVCADMFENKQISCDIIELRDYLLNRTIKSIVSIFDLDKLTDEIGPTYPTEKFLVCLRENYAGIHERKNIHKFIAILRQVWWNYNDGVIYDKEKQELTLYTMGWSGNEAIIDALQHTLFWHLYCRKVNVGSYYTFTFPKEEVKE